MGEAGNEEEQKKQEEEPTATEEKAAAEEPPPPPPPPPPPLVLAVNLHCFGCAKKIKRSVLKCRGVEAVEVNMERNQVTVKGLVDPQALCSRIHKRTKREVKVISPVLPPPAEGEPHQPQLVASQVGELVTVGLHVNMHCEPCAQQLRRRILKMPGVQTVDTDLSSHKVMVTGTMDADELAAYVRRHTKKQARVVPRPPEEEPEEAKAEPKPETPAEEEEKKEEEKKEEEPKEEEKKKEEQGKEEEKKATEPSPSEEKEKENPPAEKGEGGGEEKKDGGEGEGEGAGEVVEEENGKKMMTSYYWAPLYVIERLPPPQLFSDENPNACSIS